MRLSWVPFSALHIPLWEAWMDKPHVQAFWFLAPHQIEPYLRDKINGNGYDTAYLVLHDDGPIGYLQSTNLFVYALTVLATRWMMDKFKKFSPNNYPEKILIN